MMTQVMIVCVCCATLGGGRVPLPHERHCRGVLGELHVVLSMYYSTMLYDHVITPAAGGGTYGHE